MIISTKLRKWGNSIGVVIPNEALKEKNLKEGEEVIIEINKKNKIKQLFGSLKSLKLDSQKIKDELRKDWDKWNTF